MSDLTCIHCHEEQTVDDASIYQEEINYSHECEACGKPFDFSVEWHDLGDDDEWIPFFYPSCKDGNHEMQRLEEPFGMISSCTKCGLFG